MRKSASTRADTEDVSSVAAQWVARRDRGLSSTEALEFERWLDADPRHPAAMEHYAATWSLFDRPRRTGVTEAVLREIDVQAKRTRRRRVQTATAGLALLACAIAGWRWPQRPESVTAVVPASAVVLQPERRILPDGSVAELRAGAEIAVSFEAAVRRVVLARGEAHFQVISDSGRPFVVEAGGIHVRAVGTAFAVQLGRAEIDVLVTEGTVAVEKRSASSGEMRPAGTPPALQHLATVDAGNRLVVQLTSPLAPSVLPVVQPVVASELNERLGWRSPRLEFSATPLGEAVALMNRFTAPRNGSPKIRLVIDPASPGLASELMTGLFRADNAEAFVRVLELSLGVKAERRSETEIVLRKGP